MTNGDFNNIDKINSIIYSINSNIAIPSGHDFFSYFMCGHCNIYIKILDNVFDDNVDFYYSDTLNHVVGKIGNHFYDVCGFIPNIDLESYKKIEKELFYYLEDIHVIGNFDYNYDESIIEKGTQAGIVKYNEIMGSINKRIFKKESL